MTLGLRRPPLDVLVPTYRRPAALAVTLAGLASQSLSCFRVIVSDQSDDESALRSGEVAAVARALRSAGRHTEIVSHLPRRGLAEQRDFLLSRASAPYVLFLDDDLLLSPRVLERMLAAIRAERCGFVGCAPIGLSFAEDRRPDEQGIELWEGRVAPERVGPERTSWGRHRLHNAANVLHVQTERDFERHQRFAEGLAYVPYHVAWVGGCVLYDRAKLDDTGGFSFWRELPANHAGEDVYAQLKVMARHGGCGLLPSEVVHLELPTTVTDRTIDAPIHLPLD